MKVACRYEIIKNISFLFELGAGTMRIFFFRSEHFLRVFENRKNAILKLAAAILTHARTGAPIGARRSVFLKFTNLPFLFH